MEVLNTNNAFARIWFLWRLTGIHPPTGFNRLKRTLYLIVSIFINIFANVIFPISCVTIFFTTSDLKLLMRGLPYSISAINAIVKTFTSFFVKNDLLKLQKFFERLDTRATGDLEETNILLRATRVSQKIVQFFGFWWLMILNFVAIFNVYNRTFMIEEWFPFDANGELFYVGFIYQLAMCYVILLQDLASDTFPPCYIYVLLEHMKAFNLRVRKIGRDQEISYQELLECIKDHNDILEIFNVLQSVIGSVTFPQFCITACVFCTAAVQAFILESSSSEKMICYIFLVGIMLQVLPCCYLGNDFIYESAKLTAAIFDCNWTNKDIQFKKAMITFMSGSQMEKYFIAGGLIRLRLGTIGDIVKFTFSLFTILASANQ